MAPNLLLPVGLLILVLIGASLAMMLGGRNKKLEQRIEALAARPNPSTLLLPGRGQSIRITTTERSGLKIVLARAARMPLDLPGAHVIAPRMVFLVALLLAGVAGYFGSRFGSPLIAGVLGVLSFVVLLRTIFGWEVGKYQKLLQQQLPDAIEMVVSATRAGLPVSDAFRSLAQEMPSPTKDEFTRVVNEIALGTSPEEALFGVHRRTGVTEYSIFAVTIGVQTRSGGRLAETIQNLAATVRTRLAMAARAQALAGEAKVSAYVLGSLPFVAGAGLSVIRPGYLDPLFNDPRGNTMLIIAAVGLSLGILTMRLLIRSATKD